jgi:hypothetical protein
MFSLQETEKYIAAKYKVYSVKLSPVVKKHLKAAVPSAELVQSKGN